jgi:hypothetical protein
MFLFSHIFNEIRSSVVVKMQTAVFWVMTMCILIGHYQHFGGTCCFHFLDTRRGAGPIYPSKKLVTTNTAWCHNPEDSNLHSYKKLLSLVHLCFYNADTLTVYYWVKSAQYQGIRLMLMLRPCHSSAVRRWLPTAAAQVRVWVACEVCGRQCGTGAGFPRVLRFPLPIIPLISPLS